MPDIEDCFDSWPIVKFFFAVALSAKSISSAKSDMERGISSLFLGGL